MPQRLTKLAFSGCVGRISPVSVLPRSRTAVARSGIRTLSSPRGRARDGFRRSPRRLPRRPPESDDGQPLAGLDGEPVVDGGHWQPPKDSPRGSVRITMSRANLSCSHDARCSSPVSSASSKPSAGSPSIIAIVTLPPPSLGGSGSPPPPPRARPATLGGRRGWTPGGSGS